MKYPALRNIWLRQSDEEGYLHAMDHESGQEAYYALRLHQPEFIIGMNLDGCTDPYSVHDPNTHQPYSREVAEKALETLEDQGLLRHSRFFLRSVWDFSWSLHIIPYKRRILRERGRFFNTIMLFFWLPVWICGLLRFPWDALKFHYLENLMIEFTSAWIPLAGLAAGLLCGHIMYTIALFCSSLGYREATLFELRLRVHHLLPSLEVLYSTENMTAPLERVQVHASGIEGHLMTAGLFLLLGSVFRPLLGFCFVAALVNMVMAVICLFSLKGFNGLEILLSLMDVRAWDFSAFLVKDQFLHQIDTGVSGILTVVVSLAVKIGAYVFEKILFAWFILEVLACLL